MGICCRERLRACHFTPGMPVCCALLFKAVPHDRVLQWIQGQDVLDLLSQQKIPNSGLAGTNQLDHEIYFCQQFLLSIFAGNVD